MSFEAGWAAINLEMPRRVPRTEYSVSEHWDLIKVVTGLDVGIHSSAEIKQKAQQAFHRIWNFDFFWNILINSPEFGNIRTKMGHAEYAAGGVDRSDELTVLFDDPDDILAFDPQEMLGLRDQATLSRRFEEHYKNNCKLNPDAVNMTGIYITLVSGLIELFGWDMLLLSAGVDQEGFGEVANRYAIWIQKYFDALASTNVPIVMVHDDIVWTQGAFISPDWYRKYIFPNYKKLFAPLIEAGKKIAFTSDGNYTEFIDDVAACGVHGFVMEPTTDMAYVAKKYGKTHFFIGNADTRILLSGSKEEIKAEVQRCMNIGKSCPGFFLAVGNHIPANTPVENVLYYNDVYNELSVRK